jgi:hypothetical protein
MRRGSAELLTWSGRHQPRVRECWLIEDLRVQAIEGDQMDDLKLSGDARIGTAGALRSEPELLKEFEWTVSALVGESLDPSAQAKISDSDVSADFYTYGTLDRGIRALLKVVDAQGRLDGEHWWEYDKRWDLVFNRLFDGHASTWALYSRPKPGEKPTDVVPSFLKVASVFLGAEEKALRDSIASLTEEQKLEFIGLGREGLQRELADHVAAGNEPLTIEEWIDGEIEGRIETFGVMSFRGDNRAGEEALYKLLTERLGSPHDYA